MRSINMKASTSILILKTFKTDHADPVVKVYDTVNRTYQDPKIAWSKDEYLHDVRGFVCIDGTQAFAPNMNDGDRLGNLSVEELQSIDDAFSNDSDGRMAREGMAVVDEVHEELKRRYKKHPYLRPPYLK